MKPLETFGNLWKPFLVRRFAYKSSQLQEYKNCQVLSWSTRLITSESHWKSLRKQIDRTEPITQPYLPERSGPRLSHCGTNQIQWAQWAQWAVPVGSSSSLGLENFQREVASSAAPACHLHCGFFEALHVPTLAFHVELWRTTMNYPFHVHVHFTWHAKDHRTKHDQTVSLSCQGRWQNLA